MLSGKRTLIVEDDLGDVENLSHGLISGETMSERWEIVGRDPTSARAVHVWEQRLSHGNWAVRTVAEAGMTCTATDLRMKAALTAWEGERLIFTRNWGDSVARRFV